MYLRSFIEFENNKVGVFESERVRGCETLLLSW
jgi:hypothetical protein